MEWQYANNTAIGSTNGVTIDRTQYETHKMIELRFDPVRREHFGNYTCVAKNLADKTYAIAGLYIQCKSLSRSSSSLSHQGEEVVVTHSATSQPLVDCRDSS